jgi:hypothetical protein
MLSNMSRCHFSKTLIVVLPVPPLKKMTPDAPQHQTPTLTHEHNSAKNNGHYEGRTRDLGVISTTL